MTCTASRAKVARIPALLMVHGCGRGPNGGGHASVSPMWWPRICKHKRKTHARAGEREKRERERERETPASAGEELGGGAALGVGEFYL